MPMLRERDGWELINMRQSLLFDLRFREKVIVPSCNTWLLATLLMLSTSEALTQQVQEYAYVVAWRADIKQGDNTVGQAKYRSLRPIEDSKGPWRLINVRCHRRRAEARLDPQAGRAHEAHDARSAGLG